MYPAPSHGHLVAAIPDWVQASSIQLGQYCHPQRKSDPDCVEGIESQTIPQKLVDHPGSQSPEIVEATELYFRSDLFPVNNC